MAANVPASAAAPAARFEPNLMRRRLAGTVFLGLCLVAVGILLITLAVLLWDIVSRALPWLDAQFLTGAPSRRAERAGVLPALVGSIEIALLVALITFPIGVAAAIYLEEYATDSRLNRLLRTNIANLAGVPSIVYGILGLAFLVRGIGLGRAGDLAPHGRRVVELRARLDGQRAAVDAVTHGGLTRRDTAGAAS